MATQPKMIPVKPVKGATLPIEGQHQIPNRKILDDPRMVPNTLYYRRALRRGDLEPSSEGEIKAALAKREQDAKKRKADKDAARVKQVEAAKAQKAKGLGTRPHVSKPAEGSATATVTATATGGDAASDQDNEEPKK